MSIRYDYKWYTLDCETCPCRIEMVCYWGTYRKILCTEYQDKRPHTMKHCEFVRQPPVHSMEYWRDYNKSVHPGEKPIRTPELVQRRLL
jgi:hypothetical protein